MTRAQLTPLLLLCGLAWLCGASAQMMYQAGNAAIAAAAPRCDGRACDPVCPCAIFQQFDAAFPTALLVLPQCSSLLGCCEQAFENKSMEIFAVNDTSFCWALVNFLVVLCSTNCPRSGPSNELVSPWKLMQTYPPLDVCKGSNITFEWYVGRSASSYSYLHL